jgi:hypothetical protein
MFGLVKFPLFFNFFGSQSRHVSPALSGVVVRDASETCPEMSLAMRNMTLMQIDILNDSRLDGDSSIAFQLYNPATAVETECSAHGPTLLPDGAGGDSNTWYDCFVESRNPNIRAAFQYDAALNRLTVNETWICDNSDPGSDLAHP